MVEVSKEVSEDCNLDVWVAWVETAGVVPIEDGAEDAVDVVEIARVVPEVDAPDVVTDVGDVMASWVETAEEVSDEVVELGSGDIEVEAGWIDVGDEVPDEDGAEVMEVKVEVSEGMPDDDWTGIVTVDSDAEATEVDKSRVVLEEYGVDVAAGGADVMTVGPEVVAVGAPAVAVVGCCIVV